MTNDASVGGLGAIADVLNIRTVLPHVSEITKQVLPHDHLHLLFIDGAGHLADGLNHVVSRLPPHRGRR